VRESVGHSWPEVYFPGYGWQRFEPTPAAYTSIPVRPAQPGTESSTDSGSAAGPSLSQLEAEDRLRRLLELEELDRAGGTADIEALRRAQAERNRIESLRQLTIGGGIIAALLAGVVVFFRSLRREVQGLSPAAATYLRMGRLAAWAGLPQEQHVTPHEYAVDLGRALPQQRPEVERIVGAYVAERYSPEQEPAASELDQHWRRLRKPLLSRLLSHIGASLRPPTPPKRR